MSARKRVNYLTVRALDHLPWTVARHALRFVDFGDGSWCLGLKWSKTSWLSAGGGVEA